MMYESSSDPAVNEQDARELAEARAEIARLSAEYEDLKLLYEAMIEHGEAVEDQLAEKNILLEAIQARLEAELADATRYVFSILPEPRTDAPFTKWLLVPSTELGGDSFGYHRIDEDHFAFYLLDVCGHGVGAALLSVSVINVLRASALGNVDFRDPPAVLAALNNTFPMEKQNNMFFTIWYGVYNRTEGTLRFSTAGHPPAILLRQKQAAPELLITWGGTALGTFPDLTFESDTIAVRSGDRLLILSDGTFEVTGPDGEMLSVEALADHAANTSADLPSLLSWVRAFNISPALPDDFSLLEVVF